MAQSFIFLHGWGLNRAVWADTIEALPASAHAQALDLPGFGDAPWAAHLADFEQTVDHVASQIRQQTTTAVTLVGWSMGGLIATRLAERYPEQVAALACVATSPCFVARPAEKWPGIAEHVLAQFQQQLSGNFTATLKRFLAVQAMGSPSARDDARRLQAQVLSQPLPHPAALKAGLRWLADVDLRSSLSTLDIPLRRLYGRLDSLVPAQLAERISQGDSVTFAQSAHTPFLNQPKDFVKWLLSA